MAGDLPEIKIQCRQGTLTLSENDIIMFRDGKFILLTQSYNLNNQECLYYLPNATCNKLIRDEKLVKVKHDEDNRCDFYKLSPENE